MSKFINEYVSLIIPVLLSIGAGLYYLGKTVGEKNSEIKELETSCEVLNRYYDKEIKDIEKEDPSAVVVPWEPQIKVLVQNNRRIDCDCKYLMRKQKCQI